jgi:hypothetical protein
MDIDGLEWAKAAEEHNSHIVAKRADLAAMRVGTFLNKRPHYHFCPKYMPWFDYTPFAGTELRKHSESLCVWATSGVRFWSERGRVLPVAGVWESG